MEDYKMSKLDKDKMVNVPGDELLQILCAIADQAPCDIFTALMGTAIIKFCDNHDISYSDFCLSLCCGMYLASCKTEDEAMAKLHDELASNLIEDKLRDIFNKGLDEDDSEGGMYGNYGS